MSRAFPLGSRNEAARGFTLLETLIVLGLLSAFCLFLAQLLRSGVALFDEGERGQDLADRAQAAAGAASDALSGIVGPARELSDGQRPDARLLVQRVPLGLAAKAPLVQCLRSTVLVDPETERKLLVDSVMEDARAAMRGKSEAEIEQKLGELLATAPRVGRATMLLLPWPAHDPENAYLDLRRGLVLLGQKIELKKDDSVELFEIEDLAAGRLPAAKIEGLTETIASGILHFEIALWSQYTRDWSAGPDGGGPETTWDSARAGLLSASKDKRENFTLDLAAASLTIPSDDVWPRWARLTIVVDRSNSVRAEALLARDAGAGDTELALASTERLPDGDETTLLKVGPEWIQYRQASGTTLTGVVRARRGTVAVAHAAGAKVRAGKTIVLYVPLLCGRDNWNG